MLNPATPRKTSANHGVVIAATPSSGVLCFAHPVADDEQRRRQHQDAGYLDDDRHIRRFAADGIARRHGVRHAVEACADVDAEFVLTERQPAGPKEEGDTGPSQGSRNRTTVATAVAV